MADARVEFSIGTISFMGEGDKSWVAEQLDKILSQANELAGIAPAATTALSSQSPSPMGLGEHQPMQPDSTIAQKTLPTFLNEKGAAKSQVKKFLATAVWLESKGRSRISPKEVTQALKDANQSRLGNPSDCLAKNIAKGYCERDGREFFVTQEGKDSL